MNLGYPMDERNGTLRTGDAQFVFVRIGGGNFVNGFNHLSRFVRVNESRERSDKTIMLFLCLVLSNQSPKKMDNEGGLPV